jgi:hypothetical protein
LPVLSGVDESELIAGIAKVEKTEADEHPPNDPPGGER